MDSRSFLNTLISECNKDLDSADKDAKREFGEWQKDHLRRVFNKSVTEFYSKYKPKGYNRRGDTSSETGGLYDLFELSGLDSDGVIMDFQDDYSELYNQARMHSGRKGYDGLYQLVFVEGYHGGSKSIADSKVDDWGAHPEPDVPHYRARGFAKKYHRFYKYARWGRRAEQSTPPKELVEENMSEFFPEMDEKWKSIKKEYEDKKFEEFLSTKAQDLINDFFGQYLDRIRKAVT